MASRQVLVQSGDAEFYAQVAEGAGPQTVGLDEAISFDGVRKTLEAVGSSIVQAWNATKPSEATAEFGLALTTKAGKLTGLLVDAEGSATLKITLTWKDRPAAT